MTMVASKYRGRREYQLVYCKLLSAAQNGAEVPYMDVARILGITSPGNHMAREVGQVLGEISEDEHVAGRPMLSAVAVARDGYAGEGFYTLARTLGLLAAASTPADEIAFWMAEKRKVYEFWK